MNMENPYLHVRHPAVRQRTYSFVDTETMTHQSHGESCDINSIIRRYDNTGELPVRPGNPQYGDVTGLQGDLTDRINTSREVLDAAGRALHEKRQADEAEKQKQKQKDDEELAAYRAAAAEKESSE